MDESRAVSWRGGERKSIAEKQKGRLEAEDDRCEMQENIEGWVDGRIEWVWNGLIEEESKRQPKQVWIQKRRKRQGCSSFLSVSGSRDSSRQLASS
jgi:hypothetical protein